MDYCAAHHVDSGRTSLIAVVNCGGQNATPPACFSNFRWGSQVYVLGGGVETPQPPWQIEPCSQLTAVQNTSKHTTSLIAFNGHCLYLYIKQ